MAIWLVAAIVICLPTSVSFSSRLLGDPQIDVWNHAWGYWFVFQSLADLTLPFETDLIGAPGGGTLYYIDTPGALAALPITAIFGPAVGYNMLLLFRLTLSALGTQLLTEELSEKGWHSWVAGFGALTLPFLLCELNNGISEVCDIEWGIFALWATARYLKTGLRKHALWIGFFQGMTIMATFYYGLAIGILLVFLLGQKIIRASIQEKKLHASLVDSLLAAGISILVAFPSAFAFWSSLQSDSRLVLRDTSLNVQLLRHNAVDPRIYFHWGAFQSVNLQEEYGEPFIHTAYLRWSLFPFAFAIGWLKKELRVWLITLLLSLALGMGSYLWWGGEWLLIGGQMVSLPFEWLRALLPQIAITHPLRLSIGGQIICIAMGLAGWNELGKRLDLTPKIFLPVIGIIIGLEGLFGSSVSYPIHSSNAQIPDFYQLKDDRGVLDLPAEAGTSMRTSQYFWYQSKHQRPIPYTPDARIGSTRDLETFKNFMGDGMIEQPGRISTESALHIRDTYQLIAVHSAIDEEKSALYLEVFTEAFGEPQQEDSHWYWSLEPLSEDEKPPEKTSNSTTNTVGSTPYSSQGEAPKEMVSCQNPQEAIEAQLDGDISPKDQEKLNACGDALGKYCVQRSKNNSIEIPEALYCLDILEQYHTDDNQYAFMHLLRHPNDSLKLAIAQKLLDLPQSRSILPKERVEQLAQKESPEVQQAMRTLVSQK